MTVRGGGGGAGPKHKNLKEDREKTKVLKKWGLDWRTQDSSGPCYVSTFLQQKKDFQTINDMQINQSLIITDNVLNMGLQSLNL